MGPFSESSDSDPLARVAALAGLNGGAIHRRQVAALGVSKRELAGLVKRHLAHDIGGDVLAWGHPMLEAKGWRHAALLSCGPRSGLSWYTAAAIDGMIDWDPNTLDVTVPYGANPTPCQNVKLHRCRDLQHGDFRVDRGQRIATPLRTLLDLSPKADLVEIRRMTEVAATRHRLSTARIAERARRRLPAPGSARLYEVAMSMTNPAELRSRLERRFRSRWERAGHPPYLANSMVAGKEVDIVYHDRRLLFELDVYQWHGGETNYRNDRERARIFGRAGYDVFHIAGEDFDDNPDAVIADCAAIVDHHPPRAGLNRAA